MGFSRKSYAGVTAQESGDRLPIDSTNNPFYLVHSPLSWDYLETRHGWELLPTLMGVSRQAGVGGMEMKRGGGVDDMMWYAKKTTEDKCIVIPMDYIYEGETGYMSEWKNRNGKPFYTDRWTSPQQLGNKVIWSTDDESVNDFKRHLVHEGVIPLPHDVIVEGLKQSLMRSIERRVNAAATNADVRARKEALEHQLSLIDQAFENLKASKVPTPKKSKKASA